MAYIETRHLEDLANQTLGKTHLGEFVRRLVYASIAKFQPNLHFLSGETNGYAGWDGKVEATYNDLGTPQRHRSVWELSADREPAAKFKRDYKAALAKSLPDGWQHHEVIYVGVTLRSVTPNALARVKREIIKKHGCPWAGIVLLAADDLVQWLEKIPSVQDWATHHLHIGNGQFGKSLEQWFEAWSKQTTPNVSEKLLACGRDLSPLKAVFRLEAGPSTTLQCDSVNEAIALVHCAVQALPEAHRDLVVSSTLVVSDEALASRLVGQPLPPSSLSTVVLCPPATNHGSRFIASGYRVIHALGRMNDAPGILQFERASVRDFARTLHESMDVPLADAETHARSAGCSVSIWHINNLFDQQVEPDLPDWASGDQIDAVTAAVFAGSWSEQSTGDTNVIGVLAGMDPASFSSALAPYAICPTPLFERIGASRMVVAPTAAFQFTKRLFTAHHIKRLSKACAMVFSSISTVVLDRWQGNQSELYRRNLAVEISEGLRDGLAETLLRMALFGDSLASSGTLGGNSSGQSYVDDLIRSLPGLANDTRILASLDRQLPDLMEAAPRPFLDALDSLVQGPSDQLGLLLGDESGIFGRSFHTGLLRGLEVLAWSAEYFPRVAPLLAALAKVDPGGQLTNRPFNSLCDILLPWLPGTSCSPHQRAAILSDLVERFSEVGWRLLLELLPDNRRMSTQTQRPQWRNLGYADPSKVSPSEVAHAYELYIELTLVVAGRSVSKLADLVDFYPNLLPWHREQLLSALRSVSTSDAPPEDVQRLRSKLHKLCHRHTEFSELSWTLPRADVEQLRMIGDSLNLEDSVLKHRWLFDEQLPDIGSRQESWQSQMELVRPARQAALRSILELEGWNGIRRLIETANYGHAVGEEVGHLEHQDHDILSAMDSWLVLPSFATWMAFQWASASRVADRGEAWTDALLAFARERHWPPKAVAMAFVGYPDTQKTYDLIALLGSDEQREYWGHHMAYLRGADDDAEGFRTAAQAFLAHGRACDLIDQNWQDLPKLGVDFVLGVIDSFIESPIDETKTHSLVTIEHDLQHLFTWLRRQPEVEVEAIARREFALLPLLTNHGMDGVDLSLHQIMREQPDFFSEAICMVYKPANGERDIGEEDIEQIRSRAYAAHSLLNSWHKPPGVSGQTVDEDVVRKWVHAARQLLKSHDREAVGDQMIGKLLFYLPNDPTSGVYPPLALRNLLEHWRSNDLETGIKLESFNSRGVTSRSLFEGGRQERDLAELWRAHAAKIEVQWPRSRELCVRISEMWDRQADREDMSAREDRARQSR